MSGRLWDRDNLVPFWVPMAIAPEEQARGAEGQAQMLAELGFRRFAYFWPGVPPVRYSWDEASVPALDDVLGALDRRGIALAACWLPLEPEDPLAEEMLETFARHGVRPWLWTMQSAKDGPQTPEEWSELFAPVAAAGFPENSPEARQAIEDALSRRIYEPSFVHTPEEQQATLEREAGRIERLARLGARYGCRVGLYNHHGWFGLMENQLAMLAWLRERGVDDVGLVYTFSHSRDAFHDDADGFPELWERIRPHVAAINIGGSRCAGTLTYPSQLDSELEMMRTIEQSGWRGPVVMKSMHNEDTGDTRITLEHLLRGLEWCVAEFDRPGSGGPRPFPRVDP